MAAGSGTCGPWISVRCGCGFSSRLAAASLLAGPHGVAVRSSQWECPAWLLAVAGWGPNPVWGCPLSPELLALLWRKRKAELVCQLIGEQWERSRPF